MIFRLPIVLLALLLSAGCDSGVDLNGHYYGQIPSLDTCISYDFDIVELEYEDLRALPLVELLEVLAHLGFPTEGIENENQALTELVRHAI